jgi:sulfate adenylyltransferase subunit 1
MSSLIKFITAGNVDDGKSTLIGRLLYDSHAISNDILESIMVNNGDISFARLTDGLKAEREQGITIDVAYKYFSTEKRKFIIADCPGHREYTRNMITGASHADIAVILIDATQGITEQTRRHTFITDLINIPFLIFCINKMDAVNYDEQTFFDITRAIHDFHLINHHRLECIPVSALKGDNVVHPSENMPWYRGNTLLQLLENYQPEKKTGALPSYFQVQYVSFHNNERYFLGTLIHGTWRENQDILILPTQQKNKIKELFHHGRPVEAVSEGQPVALTLHEDTEIQRGYYLTSETLANGHDAESFQLLNRFRAVCFWFDSSPFIPAKRYILQHHSFRTFVKSGQLTEILDLDTLKFVPASQKPIELNSIFKAELISAQPLYVAGYNRSSEAGSFILIDETSFKTVGAGIIITEK